MTIVEVEVQSGTVEVTAGAVGEKTLTHEPNGKILYIVPPNALLFYYRSETTTIVSTTGDTSVQPAFEATCLPCFFGPIQVILTSNFTNSTSGARLACQAWLELIEALSS